MTVMVILPTYNESENIGRIIPRILETDPAFEVLVVDDGSPDGTAGVVEAMMASEPRIGLLKRSGKNGLGSAYRAGFREALRREDVRYVFEMDADLSHDPKYLSQFLRLMEDHDLVVGSRYLTGVNVVNWPFHRLLLSYLANVFVKWVFGMPVTDSTSGFKCFRREVLERIDLDRSSTDGYAFQVEMNYEAWKKGFRLVELPIVFYDRVEGSSKMSWSIVYEAMGYVLRTILENALSRLGLRK